MTTTYKHCPSYISSVVKCAGAGSLFGDAQCSESDCDTASLIWESDLKNAKAGNVHQVNNILWTRNNKIVDLTTGMDDITKSVNKFKQACKKTPPV